MRVTALADIVGDRVDAVGQRFGVRRRYRDAAPLLEDPEVEAVGICVPPASQPEMTLAALDAGKDVFVEKPMALALEDCDRVIERAQRTGRTVMVGFNLRWHRLLRRARDAIRRGLVGEVESVQTTLSGAFRDPMPDWVTQRAAGGGALIEKGVHHFDVWRYLAGRDAERVAALVRAQGSEDEAAVVSARLCNGALAVAVLAESAVHTHQATVHGSRGRLDICCLRFDGLRFSPASSFPGAVGNRLRRVAGTVRELPSGVMSARSGGDLIGSYRAQWRHFHAVVRRGAGIDSTIQAARHALRVALAAVESAERGTTVLLERTADRAA